MVGELGRTYFNELDFIVERESKEKLFHVSSHHDGLIVRAAVIME